MKKLLAIDDDEAVLLYLQKMLGDRYLLVTTSDPNEAVNLAIAEKPDLIMCDINMPQLDGGELSAAFSEHSETARIPFMYLTSMVSPGEVRGLCGNVGGRPGIAKRSPLPELIEAIDRMLE